MSDLIERLRSVPKVWAGHVMHEDGIVPADGRIVHEAADEIERLTAERAELRRQLAEAELDAQRYRWLRNEANTARKCEPMVCIYPLDGQDLIDGDRLDIAIDAVMGGGDA